MARTPRSDVSDQKIKSLYQKYGTLDAVCQHVVLGKTAVYYRLKKMGVDLGPKARAKFTDREVLEAFKKAGSLLGGSEILGCSVSTMKRRMDIIGLPDKPAVRGEGKKRKIGTTELEFPVEESPEGDFTARTIEADIFIQADSLEALRENARDAVVCHFENPDDEFRGLDSLTDYFYTSMKSVLGYLVNRFKVPPENLSTDALCFILENSKDAANAFIKFFSTTGISLPDSPIFEIEKTGDDGSRPDLICRDSDNNVHLVLETKFEAELTINQPVSYFDHLSENKSGLVVVLAPIQRHATLWPELLERCQEARFQIKNEILDPQGIRYVDIGIHKLALTSWVSLLNFILNVVDRSEEKSTSENVRQILGLCEEMDWEVFSPIKPEEIRDQNLTQRMMNYAELVFTLAKEAKEQELPLYIRRIERYGNRSNSRYINIEEFGGSIGLEEEKADQYFTRRLKNYADLATAIATEIKSQGICSFEEVNATYSKHSSGQYINLGKWGNLGNWGGRIGFELEDWRKNGITPLWLRFFKTQWGQGDKIHSIFSSWQDEIPPKYFEEKKYISIPIFIQSNVDREMVVNNAVVQIRKLIEILRNFQVEL